MPARIQPAFLRGEGVLVAQWPLRERQEHCIAVLARLPAFEPDDGRAAPGPHAEDTVVLAVHEVDELQRLPETERGDADRLAGQGLERDPEPANVVAGFASYLADEPSDQLDLVRVGLRLSRARHERDEGEEERHEEQNGVDAGHESSHSGHEGHV